MTKTSPMRQVDGSEIRRPLVPIAEASVGLRDALERVGVVFEPDDDPSLPGPSDTAAVELQTGTQFAFEHFHTHPACFIVVRAERGPGQPGDRVAELLTATGFDRALIGRVEASWDVAG
jgi:hypothetical protein